MTDRLVVLPSQLTPAEAVFEGSAFVVDNGMGMEKATASQIVETGRPNATEAEAVTGLDNFKSMTALRVRQSIASSPTATVASGASITAAAAQSTATDAKLQGIRRGAKAAVLAATQTGVMERDDPTWLGQYRWDATVPVATHTASPELFLAPNPAADGAWVHQGGARIGTPFFAPDARVHRFNDRVLIGDSAATDAVVSTTPGAAWSWLATTPALDNSRWMEANGRVVVTTEFGLALVGGAHVNPASPASRSVFGVTGIVFNEGLDAGLTARAWGGYIEAHHKPAAGKITDHTTLFEYQIANYVAGAPALTPAGSLPTNTAHGGTIGSGVHPDAVGLAPVSWALRFEGTGSTFMSGIVFRHDALEPWVDGASRAILMNRLHNLSWWDGTDEVAQIQVSAQTAANALKIDINNTGFAVYNASNKAVFLLNKGPSNASKFLSIAASASSSEPAIVAGGDQANVDILLTPKGTGMVRFGSWTSNPDAAVNGYITIKDAAGTLRKIPTIA